MHAKVFDLIFILEFFLNSETLEKKILILNLNRMRITQYVDWNETYELGIHLQFLKEIKNNVKITPNGKIFFSMYGGDLELSKEQKSFVFNKGILKNNYFAIINSFLQLFTLNKNQILELYKTEKKFHKIKLNLDDKLILQELDIISIHTDTYTINKNYSEKIIQTTLFNSKELTQTEYDQILDEQKRIGDLAEDLSLKYEKNQFKKKKWAYQEEHVKIVGKKNVKLGYDIESFLTKNSRLNYMMFGDKHIEVKGRKYNEFSFIISANELNIGKLLSERKNEEYFIYFWNNLGSKDPPAVPTKIIPFKNLKIKLCKNCLKYLVELN